MKILFTVFYDPMDLGIRYLVSYLRQYGHTIRIVALKNLSDVSSKTFTPHIKEIDNCTMLESGYCATYDFHPITDKELELLSKEVRNYAPDFIGFGTRSKNFVHLPRIIPALKEGAPHAFLACGGAGPTLNPEVPLKLGVDAVIRGEGEYALHELVSHLEEGKDWRHLQNITFKDTNDAIVSNPLRSPQRNLDKFPFPTIELENDILINNNKRVPLLRRDNYDTLSFSSNFRYFVLGSRGCMAACSYCGGRYLHEEYAKDGIIMPRVRQRSLNNILDELIIAKKNIKMRMIQFWDEFFIWPIDQLIHFFKLYKEKIDLPFWAYLSSDQLAKSEDLLETVCQAGLATFSIGLQAADEGFCKEVYNRINHNINILKAIEGMDSNDVPTQLLMILGNPLQKAESLRKNWEFLAQLPAFDPSFKRRRWLRCTKLYKPYYPSQFFNEHPEIHNTILSNREFYYDSMVCNLRLILEDDAFYSLIENDIYKKNPEMLGSLYYDTLEKKHLAYLTQEIERLKYQEVYYWGCGNAYQYRKHLFSSVKPLYIFNDFSWEDYEAIDNIRVVNPESVNIDTNKPLVIFARYEFANTIYRKAKYLYGFSDIVIAAFI